jgi:hypothetical protein
MFIIIKKLKVTNQISNGGKKKKIYILIDFLQNELSE